MKALAILALLAASGIAQDDGKIVIEIPAAVQAAITKEKGESGKVTDFKRVNDNDGTAFVVGMLLDGKPYLLSLDAAGRVMRKQLDTGDDGPKMAKIEMVPPRVRATLQREAGAGLIDEIETHHEVESYVTEVRIGTRRYRIVVDAQGLLLSKDYVGDAEDQ